ncbi:Retinal-specific ATP-binding cassette transporter [Orchesella cincta]|uniref:Retinal-specific ATP-binding cassette transporter n=1 Tax=Orchesella cincta TaxID=48709 RepID=A0A1D2M7D8_ORCCI|nr:Retinal-specific ATP-binding cassette transporter [Orchesella cincta]
MFELQKTGVSCFKPITYISWIYKRESKRHDRRPPSLGPQSQIFFWCASWRMFWSLGVNGAGKTTTFRMLTGDETRSAGNVYAFMKSLDEDRIEFLSNIGTVHSSMEFVGRV